MPLYDCEHYYIRNALTDIIGNVILKLLCNSKEVCMKNGYIKIYN
jgi:hypothetical protein